jgi:hypothetical protein
MRHFIILSFMLLGLLSCKAPVTDSSKKAENPIKLAKYYIRYVESIKELQLEAKYFNKNDSAYPVPGGVYHSDIKLEAKNLPKEGWVHRYIKRPEMADSLYVFKYSPIEGLELKDSVIFAMYPDFKLETPKISKKVGGLLSWTGNSLGQDDGLTLIFDDASGTSYTINHVGITRGAQLEIRPEHLEVFAKGKAVLRVVHKKTVIGKIANMRIVRLTEYYRSPVELEIVD